MIVRTALPRYEQLVLFESFGKVAKFFFKALCKQVSNQSFLSFFADAFTTRMYVLTFLENFVDTLSRSCKNLPILKYFPACAFVLYMK